MTLRFHEIAESRHRILNPFSPEKLQLIGQICVADGRARVLDLCCGKAEMLCTWSAVHGVSGTGVDISKIFLAAARDRAVELGVDDRITLVHADAVEYLARTDEQFDVVSCLGATWIGHGLGGTLDLMRPRAAANGLVVVGEPYWVDPLPDGTSMLGVEPDEFATLADTLDIFAAGGFDLVEMVLANADDWDRYVASQWKTTDQWLKSNADDPDAPAIKDWIKASQRSYLGVERRYLGWGVFVLRDSRSDRKFDEQR